MPKPITPLLAADIIIELTDFPDRPIVLIERANPPYGWAIPGGFVDLGEIVEQAAVREAQEEVNLDVRLIALLGIYSDPSRDARGHTVTAVYVAEAAGTPVAADDAKNCRLFRLHELPELLAFDHAQVLADYKKYRETGQVTPLHNNPVRVSDKPERLVIH
ncbi:MAG: NUDIX hydrolase [Methylococcaceae bacterium]|jgi:8-oxo-dGTP diphosphatase